MGTSLKSHCIDQTEFCTWIHFKDIWQDVTVHSRKISVTFVLKNTLEARRLAAAPPGRGVWTLIFLGPDQFCFANFESESASDLVPTKCRQSDSCLTPHKFKSSKQPATFFQQTQNPSPIPFRLQQRKPHSWSCRRQEEYGSKKSKIQSMHTSGVQFAHFFLFLLIIVKNLW